MADILITNDDGIESPGLLAAVQATLHLGEVTVVAPSRQQTSAGRGLRGDGKDHFHETKLAVDGVPVRAYHCDASPARVVMHALDVLFRDRHPALLVSGVNYGENLGTNITMSGTVGAALHAAAHGIPAIAAAIQTSTEHHRSYPDTDFTATRHFLSHFSQLMLTQRLPPDADVLNLNVPASATPATPWRITRLSRQTYFSTVISSPRFESRLGEARVGYGFKADRLEPDSDIRALTQGLVSVTPLSVDLTARVDLHALRDLFSEQPRSRQAART